MFPTNSERLIGISDAFSAFVYGYPSSCPRAYCTPNKSVTTLHYTRRHGPVYIQLHARKHLPSAVPWISEDRLLGEHLLYEPSSGYSSNCDEATFGVQKALLNMFWEYSPSLANTASDWLSAKRALPRMRKKEKYKWNNRVDTSVDLEGIDLFVDLWEVQPCLWDPK